jgi:hypothetical protein
VKDPCAGNATSTFGGGGGTKVFCSQALKTPNAARAKATRQTAALLFQAAQSGLKRAGEREAVIFRAPIRFLFCKRPLLKNRLPAIP